MGVLTFAALSYVARNVYRRLDRLGIFDVNTAEAHRSTAWVDGLRGISAFGVVASHLSTCLAQFMFEACCAQGSSYPSIFQLPPLRVLAAGHSWLAMFFLLSGFVSALAPLNWIQTGELGRAYSSLGRASLKRPLRFVLPATIVTCVSWLICQLGGYVAARRVHMFLLSTNSPSQSESLFGSLKDLATALITTWRWPDPQNRYEDMQYALVWMLQGSYMVYAVLLGLVGVQKRARVGVIALILFLSFHWSFKLVDPFVGPTYLSGVLLAEFWTSESRLIAEGYSPSASPLMAVLGVVLMAWPKNRAEALTWTSMIKKLLVEPLPEVRDPERLVGTTGVVLITLAVLISPRVRQGMSHPFLLWLGKVSFAVYLLHMTIIRLAMPWLLFISNPIKAAFLLGESGEKQFESVVVTPTIFRKTIGLFALVLLVLTAAHQWTRLVEPHIERVSTRIETFLSGKANHANGKTKPHYRQEEFLPQHHNAKPA